MDSIERSMMRQSRASKEPLTLVGHSSAGRSGWGCSVSRSGEIQMSVITDEYPQRKAMAAVSSRVALVCSRDLTGPDLRQDGWA